MLDYNFIGSINKLLFLFYALCVKADKKILNKHFKLLI